MVLCTGAPKAGPPTFPSMRQDLTVQAALELCSPGWPQPPKRWPYRQASPRQASPTVWGGSECGSRLYTPHALGMEALAFNASLESCQLLSHRTSPGRVSDLGFWPRREHCLSQVEFRAVPPSLLGWPHNTAKDSGRDTQAGWHLRSGAELPKSSWQDSEGPQRPLTRLRKSPRGPGAA